MAKTTHTAVARRYFRKYYRTYRYMPIANRINLNYYVAKINLQAALIMANNSGGTSGIGFRFANTGTWTNVSESLVFITTLRTLSEYIKYSNMFNEVMLLGCKVISVPTYRTVSKEVSGNSFVGHLELYYNTDPDHSDVNQQDGMIINMNGKSQKYWRNLDRHWYPSQITSAQSGTGLVNMGYLQIGANDNSVLQSLSPSFNLYITLYCKFRKNRLNA